MPNWTAFAGFVAVLVALLLFLARASQSLLGADGPASVRRGSPGSSSSARTDVADAVEPPERGEREGPTVVTDVGGPSEDGEREEPSGAADTGEPPDTGDDPTVDAGPAEPPARDGRDASGTAERRVVVPSPDTLFTPGELFLNVAVSHGIFGLLLVGAVVYTGIPPAALGVGASTPTQLAVGVALGVALYLANEVGAAVAELVGIDHEETLRELLAPDSPTGWAILLVGVLPLIAGFEELLFRGALVGALAAGFAVSPWLLAALSSVLFAFGHGAQGVGGILVTGVLGFVLAAAFVATGSLLVVVVAHYVVNALEFVVHEGLGVEWTALEWT